MKVPRRTLEPKPSAERLLLYLLGRSHHTLLDDAANGIPAERPLAQTIIQAMTAEGREDPVHYEVVAPRKQGKSTLLAQVAVQLAQEPRTTVLWEKATHDEVPEHLESLYQWLRNLTKRPRVVHTCVLVIDDVMRPSETRLSDQRADFIARLMATRPKRIRLRLLTAASECIDPTMSNVFSVALQEGDELSLAKVTLASLGAEPIESEVQKLLAFVHTGMSHRGDLMGLIGLLWRYVDTTVGVEEHVHLRGLKSLAREPHIGSIAASEAIDLEVPATVLKALGVGDTFQLLDRSDGWLRELPDPYGGRGGAVGLPGPWAAEVLLKEAHLDPDVATLTTLYGGLVKAAVSIQSTSAPHYGDFARHILHRLSSGKHFRFGRVSGDVVARRVFREHAAAVKSVAIAEDTVAGLCLWAATLTKLGDWLTATDMMRTALARRPDGGGTISTHEFVALSSAATESYQSALRDSVCELLPAALTTGREAIATRPDGAYRFSQVLHAGARLLVEAGRIADAVALIEQERTTVQLTAPTYLLLARLLADLQRTNDARAAYISAVSAGRLWQKVDPDGLVHSLTSAARFAARRPDRTEVLATQPSLPSAVSLCDEALTIASATGIGLDAVYEARGDIAPLRDKPPWYRKAIEATQHRGRVNSHAVISLATALRELAYGESDSGKYLEAASALLHAASTPGVEDADRVHLLREYATLIATCAFLEGEHTRPALQEAIALLTTEVRAIQETGARGASTTMTLANLLRDLGRIAKQNGDRDWRNSFTQALAAIETDNLSGRTVWQFCLWCRFESLPEEVGVDGIGQHEQLLEEVRRTGLAGVWFGTRNAINSYSSATRQLSIDDVRLSFARMANLLGEIGVRDDSPARMVVADFIRASIDDLERESNPVMQRDRATAVFALLADLPRGLVANPQVWKTLTHRLLERKQRSSQQPELLRAWLGTLLTEISVHCDNDAAWDALLYTGDARPLWDGAVGGATLAWTQQLNTLLEQNADTTTRLRAALLRRRSSNGLGGFLCRRLAHIVQAC